MKVARIVLGVLIGALGALWLVQGLGLVHIEPIACVANCAPLEGPSPGWAVAGAAMLAVAVFLIRKRPR